MQGKGYTGPMTIQQLITNDHVAVKTTTTVANVAVGDIVIQVMFPSLDCGL